MKILLVDDHCIVRTGLRALISNFIAHSIVDEASDGDSAIELVKNNDYEILVLDVNLPGTDSYGLVSNILIIKPASKILMFSMNAEENYAKRYLKLGAMGYIRKDESEEEIKKAINIVLSSRRYISESLSLKLQEEAFGHRENTNPFEKLSPREFEIIQHIIRGESVGEISQKLNLHTSTIGTHKARIFEKLNCRNAIEINSLAKTYSVIEV